MRSLPAIISQMACSVDPFFLPVLRAPQFRLYLAEFETEASENHVTPNPGFLSIKSYHNVVRIGWLKREGANCELYPLIHTSATSESSTKCGSWVLKEKVWSMIRKHRGKEF